MFRVIDNLDLRQPWSDTTILNCKFKATCIWSLGKELCYLEVTKWTGKPWNVLLSKKKVCFLTIFSENLGTNQAHHPNKVSLPTTIKLKKGLK